MNCDWVKANAVLFVYDELPDGERFELQQHLERCPDCAREADALRALQKVASFPPRLEPDTSLLAASRLRLSESLEHASPHAAGWRRVFDVAGWMQSVRFAPALAVLLLMVGFGSGMLVTWRMRAPVGAPPSASADNEASLAGIRGVQIDPATNKVQISYDKLTPDSVQGSLDDPRIQQLLVYSSQYKYNPGVRMDSVDLLAKNGDKDWARAALLYALRYDSNPGVRLKALDGLQAYVADDLRVRNAVIEALLTDANQGIRNEAIRLLEPVKGDSSVREALAQLAAKEQNPYLRAEAQRMLASMPRIY